ncbi:MAG: acyltransferase [Colwellia sp.]|nr:acyltransferase [Colwellia sp.]
MEKSTSIYLDASRFLAALVVFIFHFIALDLVNTDYKITFAREAVMIFFVLSGYVIAFVSAEKERTFKVYIFNRLSRLYSVVIPALILTVVLDSIAINLAPELYEQRTHENIIERLMISVLFLNQIWNLTVMPLSNGPFWSISFEFWYYLIFAAVSYLPTMKQKCIWVIVFLLVCGPKIVVLLPCWFIGVFAYQLSTKWPMIGKKYALLFLCSLVAMLLVVNIGNPMNELVTLVNSLAQEGYLRIFNVAVFFGQELNFFNDYFFCLLFATSILTAKAFFSLFNESKVFTSVIRYFASHTFSLYLYHVPLILFFQAVLKHEPDSLVSVIILILLIFLSIGILAKYTEHKKSFYYAFLEKVFNRFVLVFPPRQVNKDI